MLPSVTQVNVLGLSPAILTLLSAVQLFAIGLSAVINGTLASRVRRAAWFGLGLLFYFLTIDEAVEVHESLADRLATLGFVTRPAGELLVLLSYIAIGTLLIVWRLGPELFDDDLALLLLGIGGGLLLLWVVGSAAPPGVVDLPETALKLVGFFLIMVAFLRRNFMNSRGRAASRAR